MGRWLARLKTADPPGTDPTKPTEPPEWGSLGGFGGFVGSPQGGIAKIQGDESANEASEAQTASTLQTDPTKPTEPYPDPDRYCWPHSPAMNTAELAACGARVARFAGLGLSLDDAERMADKLTQRDREADDRHSCMECVHLGGYGRWRCTQWRQLNAHTPDVAHTLVLLLRRCTGFADGGSGA